MPTSTSLREQRTVRMDCAGRRRLAVDRDRADLQRQCAGYGEGGAWTGPARHANVTLADQRAVPDTVGRVRVHVDARFGPPLQAWAGTPRSAFRLARDAHVVGRQQCSVVHLQPDRDGSRQRSSHDRSRTLGPARTATVTIANRSFTISQASGCEYRFDPAATTFAAAGGLAAITMSATTGCSWTAASEADWIAIAGGQTGIGPGTISINVSPNAGPQRSTAITAEGSGLRQRRRAAARTRSSRRRGIFLPRAPLYGSSSSTTPTCPWTASSQADWLTVTTGAAGGTGYALVSYVIAPNPGPPRTGTLTIGEHKRSLRFRPAPASTEKPRIVALSAIDSACLWSRRERSVSCPGVCSRLLSRDAARRARRAPRRAPRATRTSRSCSPMARVPAAEA